MIGAPERAMPIRPRRRPPTAEELKLRDRARLADFERRTGSGPPEPDIAPRGSPQRTNDDTVERQLRRYVEARLDDVTPVDLRTRRLGFCCDGVCRELLRDRSHSVASGPESKHA